MFLTNILLLGIQLFNLRQYAYMVILHIRRGEVLSKCLNYYLEIHNLKQNLQYQSQIFPIHNPSGKGTHDMTQIRGQ